MTPQHLASNQQLHSNVSGAGHQHAMGPDGSQASAGNDQNRDMYQQRPYQSASGGNSAEYSTGGGNLDVSNKKMAR